MTLIKPKIFVGLLFMLWIACVISYFFFAEVDGSGLINLDSAGTVLKIILIAGFTSGFIGWVWMMFDCASMKKSRKKTVWSMLLAFGSIFGATAYYISVYLQTNNEATQN